jgi:guanylate kinase
MRAGEQPGVDYHFVSKEQFETWIADDQLLEHALVYGQHKGIPRHLVTDALARGSDVILRLDVQVRAG